MTVLRLPRTVLADSFSQLRRCGAGRKECVVYWCAALDQPDVVNRVVHPVHHAGPGWYEVDSDWVTEFFLQLRADRDTVQVQVHTHPREAGHSGIDDRFALAPVAGFHSLVLPDYATGPIGFADAALVRMQLDGTWQAVPPEEVFHVE